MKKMLSIGACAAILLSGTAVFAESAQGAYLVAEKSGGEYVSGGTVTFSVKVTKSGITKGAFIVSASGLELTSSKVESGTFSAGTSTASFTRDTAFSENAVAATFTYKVTAKAGENVRFAISEHADYPGATDPIPVTGMVSESGVESGAASTSETSSENAVSDSDGSSGASGGNPITGIAISVVPLVLTSAAVIIAARKRK